MRNRLINATEFKSHCLSLLDEIENQGGTITVTKRGRPVATISRVRKQPWKSPKGVLAEKAKIVGDIVSFSTADLWDAVRGDAVRGDAVRGDAMREAEERLG